MAVNEVAFHMNSGNDDASYANNSAHQKFGMLKTWRVLEETLKEMLNEDGIPRCLKMADLGCSSGPNTLSIISRIIHKVEELCPDNNLPEFEVFLNDLPTNDFNNLFKIIPTFYDNLNLNLNLNHSHRIFISGLPGSFYGRLFPSKTLNFVYASYSLQWLSQVPEGLESNREKIHMAMASPRAVHEAYAKQYKRDFGTFLRSRGEEMVGGGRMVLLFVGRRAADPSTRDDCQHFELMANTLAELSTQGLIKEGDLHSFNLPIYPPCKQELEAAISDEGSFNLDMVEGFDVPWDAHVDDGTSDGERRAELVCNFIRAYTEPVLAQHFGTSIIPHLFHSYAKKLAHQLSTEKPMFYNFIVSLRRR